MTDAAEHNARTRNRRQQAADEQGVVVPLDKQPASMSLAELHAFAAEQADAVAALGLEVKGLNERRKAIFDGIEAKGFDRKAFKDMVKVRAMEEDARLKYEASRRQLAKAFGFDDGAQLDLLAPVEPATPREEAPMTTERLSAISDHIAKHGTRPLPEQLHA